MTLISQREKHFARKEKVHGQFMPPPQVADFIVSFASTNIKSCLGIDPSCGDGVFLKALSKMRFDQIVGIDIDREVIGELPLELTGHAQIWVGDGLQPLAIYENSADIVVGNPPFSAKYGRVTDLATLSNFELGKGRKSQAIEILFLKRFLQLARPDGVVGIILPQGIFSRYSPQICASIYDEESQYSRNRRLTERHLYQWYNLEDLHSLCSER